MSSFIPKKTVFPLLLLASTLLLASCGEGDNPVLPAVDNGETLVWEEGSPLPVGSIGIQGAGAAAVDGKFYLVGGFERDKVAGGVWEYDPVTSKWRNRAPMPTPRGDMGIAVMNGLIYTFGGREEGGSNEIAVSNVEVFNPETNSWTTLAPIPASMGATVAVVAGSDIYLMGGWVRNGVSGLVQCYNSRSRSWTQAAEMPTPRMFAAAGLVGQDIIVAGGEQMEGPRLTIVESYSILTNSWSEKPSLSRGRSAAAGCTIEDRFYVIGGLASEDPIYMTEVEWFNPSDEIWSASSNLPLPTSGHSAAVINDEILVFGGGYYDFDAREIVHQTNLVVGRFNSN